MNETHDTGKSIHGYFEERYAPHVPVIMLDDFVRAHVKEQARQHIHEGYDNNCHVFALVQKVAAKADAFHLVHRLKYDCRDCFELASRLGR
ncbi:expressed unknown protein [Seminavis robusta]|uniref:Uncharacterized protein n=1 Tax=Seminavis robusta TaxID=568900 RepID=A0A9N8HD30_9STRA|nr:expressed unknown protein [Seminavis robusta]|eukprot:Sro326_g118040.1 n/a (91) ;mRNA; r:20494-20766